jgi:hypothetical protein
LIATPVTTSLAASRLRLRAATLCNHCDHWADAAGTVVSHINTSRLSFSGPLQCRSQPQRYWAGSHVGDMWYGLLERECFFLARMRLSLGLLTSLFPVTIRKLGSCSDGCAHMPAVRVLGSSTSQIDVFFAAVVLTIIPNGPWKGGLSIHSGQLALQRGT